MPDPPNAVQARGLAVAYGDVVALDGLDLTAPAGAITAVLGPNGAGKTTLIRVVATLQSFEGQLEVAGFDIRHAPGRVRRQIALSGQHAAVVERLTGRENLRLVARLHGQGRREAREAAEAAIESLSLVDFADRRVATYSGGQRRRLDLAATLVAQPRLLLLDEPTIGVDPHSRQQLWKLIRQLPQGGTSVLLTTQYLDEAEALADFVAVIDAGRTVACGTPDELRGAAGTTTLTIRPEQGFVVDQVAAVAASLNAEVANHGQQVSIIGSFTFDQAATAVQRAGIRVSELSWRPPTLDEVFFSLTQPESGR